MRLQACQTLLTWSTPAAFHSRHPLLSPARLCQRQLRFLQARTLFSVFYT